MNTIEESIIKEASRPFSDIISAAIGSKVEKVKKWSEDRELEKDASNENLSKTVELYLIKLAERTSEITSIAFPQKKLPISEAYEPLTLKTSQPYPWKKSQEYSIEEIIDNRKNNLIIIDNAGMGKTTFSKYIITNLLFKSDRIPIFFELRKIEENTNLIDALAAELDLPGKRFKRELFYKLIEKGKFYVILDGFDEIKLDLQQTAAREIKELSEKGGDNTLLLTSRPQQNVPEIKHSQPLEFVPFTEEQVRSMLDRYDKLSELDVGERLKKEIVKIPEKLMESPLLVSLLYRTFGVNNSIAERASTFYGEIYDALYKGHDLANKNGYTREKKSLLDFENFRKLLRALSYYMILSGKTALKSIDEAITSIEQASKISYIQPRSSHKFLEDLQTSVPVMQRDGNEYRFLHKTIMEYFAAEYIISSSNSGELTSKIFNGKVSTSFTKVFDFIEDINPKLYHSTITKQIAEGLEKLNIEDTQIAKELATAETSSDLIVGIWPTKGNSEISGNPKRKVPSEDLFKGVEYHQAMFRKGTLDGVRHWIILFIGSKEQKIPKNAWKELSESSPRCKRTVAELPNLNKYKKTMEIGKKTKLTLEILECETSKNNQIFREMIEDLLPGGRNKDEIYVNTLSPIKIKAFLRSQEEQLQIEKEIENYF